MKKTFIICFLLSFSFQFVFAQVPTQAEIDKMMKQAQELMKKYGADTNVKKAMENQPVNNNAVTNSFYSSDPGSYGNVDNWRFPVKNTALLSSLPKKVFTRAGLVSFLNDAYAQLSKKLTPGVAASVQSVAAKYNNDGNEMGDAAIAGWYTNYREEALLLIIKAAANNPDNGVLLNNCAALMNMSGIEQKAIPVLKYVLQSYPGNSMLLNNLGQAYAGLGETDTAMVYLGRCMKIEPEHPEACNTAGQIEATKGNKDKAIEYFEKSIKSAYTKTAQLKLRKIKKDSKIAPLVRPRVKLPEYFNLFKYQLPEQCTSIDNAAVADAEHKAFREMAGKQANLFAGKLAQLLPEKEREMMKLMNTKGAARILKKNEFMAHPFYEFCGIMAGEVWSEFQDELQDLSTRVTKKYFSEMEALENEYKNKYRILQEAGAQCPAYNNLANQYLPMFAALTVDWQKKNMLVHQKYFDELVYWHYLALRPNGVENLSKDHHFKIRYYEFIIKYLVMMNSVCHTRVITPACEITETPDAAKESNAINEIECPVEIEIPFIVGKFELNCEKIAFSGGEGAVFSYEKNFKTRKSTLSVGIGLTLNIGKVNLGPVEAKVSAGVSESLFITFDGDNKIFDYGLKFGAKASAGVEAKGEKEVAPGKSIEVKRELNNKEIGVGYKFGINSGWDFNEGPFKGMIGPAPEKQINKNVPIYNPKQG